MAALVCLAFCSAAQATGVPSGQQVALHEVLSDRVGTESWVRFRFLAPQIGRAGGGLSFHDVEADFDYLCGHVVLPYLAEFDLAPDIAVITLLDRPVVFGATDPEATQFIEMFRVTSGTCIWEGI